MIGIIKNRYYLSLSRKKYRIYEDNKIRYFGII